MYRSAAVLLLVAAALLPGQRARAGRAPVMTASRTARGVRLTLDLPRQTYPRDALVRVSVTVQSVSRTPVLVGATAAPECMRRGPGVQVLDAAGAAVYPPAAPWVMASCGHPIFPAALPPGHTLHHTMLTVLRGPEVRGVAAIGPMGSAHQVVTPPLRITFTDEPPPTLTLATAPNLHLIVTPSRAISSRMFYFVYGSVCPQSPPGTQYRSETPRWERTGLSPGRRFRLLADCAAPIRWVFAGGWLNHPAVSLDYPR